MEAKDIVAEELARQAEFGYEPSWLDFVIAGQKAGIREVVDYLNERDAYDELTVKAFWEEDWQTKLKEWEL